MTAEPAGKRDDTAAEGDEEEDRSFGLHGGPPGNGFVPTLATPHSGDSGAQPLIPDHWLEWRE